MIQALLAEKYIYGGGQQIVSINTFTNEIPKFTLQPFVYKALDHYKPKLRKEILKLSEKVSSEKDVIKKARLKEKLCNVKEYYTTFYEGDY